MRAWMWAEGLDAIDFAKIVGHLSQATETEMGRARVARLRPHPSQRRLGVLHAALREAKGLLGGGDAASLAGAEPVGQWARIARKGGGLGGERLWHVAVTLRIAERVLGFIRAGTFPSLQRALGRVEVPVGLADTLEQAVREDGSLYDHASTTLTTIRRQMREEARALDTIFDRILSMPSWLPYLQERIVTQRLGRRVVPIKIEFRNQVRGLVHDQSASGQTVFVEPLEAVQHQNRMTMLERDEADEIDRIVSVLWQAVGEHGAALERLETRLGWLDEILAKVRYGAAMNGILPSVGGDRLLLRQARHPLVNSPVPITVELSTEKPIVVISGPNTGGKTVALKTTGLVVAMAMAGMMVPCAEGTQIPLYHRLWLDIGDEQSIEQNLSTFSGHLSRLIPMIEHAQSGDLCLVDEMGGGTDPDEGGVLAEAMIERLLERGAQALISTHLGRLKLMAYRVDGIENAQVEFDRETLRPTYRLLTGYPGSSHALYIAERLGMASSVLERARAKVDPEAKAMQRALSELENIQAEVREALRQLQLRETELGRQSEELRRLEDRLRREREEMRERGMNAWRRQLDDANRKFTAAVEEVHNAEAHARQQAMEALRAAYREVQAMPAGMRRTESGPDDNSPLTVGDWVAVEGVNDPAKVVEIHGSTATVDVAGLRLKLPLGDVHRTDVKSVLARPTPRARSNTPSRLGRTVGTEVDLRGMTVDDAIFACDRYLEEAVLGDVPWVRIIHGKGTGALRRAIQEQLARDPRIVQYRLGQSGEGGDGVTIAYLEAPNDQLG